MGVPASTLKRHGYYCRSRRATAATRSRACIPCARSKVRCDNTWPQCSKCVTKAIECHFPASTPRGRGPETYQGIDAPTQRGKRVPRLVADSSCIGNHEASNDGDMIFDNAFFISEQEVASAAESYLNWFDLNTNFTDLLDPQNSGAIQSASSESSHLTRYSTPSSDQQVQVQPAISSPVVSLSTFTLATNAHRTLVPRPKVKTGAQRIAKLMLHTLKSYPIMMLRHDSLPPFIHPHLLSSNVEHNHMEPLTNCISLVHMLSSGVHGSRRLFWKKCAAGMRTYMRRSA